MIKRNIIILLLLLFLLAGCGTPTPEPTPQPPGTITGTVTYENLTGDKKAQPSPGVMVALCRFGEDLPEGPVVAESNNEDFEKICTLQGNPTALTNSEGAFTLENVPPGSYLILFHLFPDKLGSGGTEWDGIEITEADFNGIDQEIISSNQDDFWQEGGLAIALANWSASDGMTVASGNVCSNKIGLCFSIQDQEVHPVVNLAPDGKEEVVLTAHLKPEK